MEASSQLILLGGLLLTLSVFAGLLSARLGAPLLLAFMGLGMLSGEDGPGKIHFNDFRAAYLIGSVSLAIILFEGGISTKWGAVRKLVPPSIMLGTAGVAVTAGIVAAAAHYGFGVAWLDALLIGAIVAPTDVAAVISVLHLQNLQLRSRIAAILELESGLNDPMAVFLTVLLVEFVLRPVAPNWLDAVGFFAVQMAGGAAIGLLGGRALLFFFRRLDLSAGLYPIFGLAGALTLFGGAQIIGASGFLATYLAALVLGNGRYAGKQAVDRFFNALAWLSQIVLFLMLGLLVTPRALLPILGPAFGVAAILILIARPVAVAVCLLPFRFNWRETLFISWVGLRGAVPIFLATIPVIAGARGGVLLFGTAFIVVMVSLLVQGWTVAPLARWLRLDAPGKQAPTRLDIELPEKLVKSGNIVGYRIERSSPAVGLQLASLPLPAGADVLLTVREGTAFGKEMTSPLAPDDYILVWGNQNDFPALDSILGPRSDRTGASPAGAFGEFAFPGTALLPSVVGLYDSRPLPKKLNVSLNEYLIGRLGRPSIGDRLQIGAIELIIRDMDGDEITSVGVEVDPRGMDRWRAFRRRKRLPIDD